MNPDFIVADSGSDDIGPVLLGSDTSCSPLDSQTQDLEQMLLASRSVGVPMIIGSAGDTGANSRVDLYVGIIKDLAAKHTLSGFRLGYFYSEVEKDSLRKKLHQGEAIDQDFLFGRPGAYTIADYRLRCNGFRTAARFGTPFAAAPAFACWPIMAFQRSQRAL